MVGLLVSLCSLLSKMTLPSLQTAFCMSYECHKAMPALHPKDAVIVPGLQILLKFSTAATYVAVAMKLDRWEKSSELSKPLKLVIGSKYAGMDITWPFIYSTRLIAEHVRASWGFQRLFYWQLNACSTLDDFTVMQHTPCFRSVQPCYRLGVFGAYLGWLFWFSLFKNQASSHLPKPLCNAKQCCLSYTMYVTSYWPAYLK